MLGGAAVTEEVFPGFKFSVFSYVVSLLRPEIIRDLDLPRHGLEILPLDGTHANAKWRLSVAGQRPREDTTGDRPAFEAGCRSLRRIRQGNGADVPFREADSKDGAARSFNARSARIDEDALSGSAFRA